MTDLEITRLCAEAMGIEYFLVPKMFVSEGNEHVVYYGTHESDMRHYDPLDNDCQAMDLVKALELWIQPPNQGPLNAGKTHWFVAHNTKGGDSTHDDLNRAICLSVAKMQKAKP